MQAGSKISSVVLASGKCLKVIGMFHYAKLLIKFCCKRHNHKPHIPDNFVKYMSHIF